MSENERFNNGFSVYYWHSEGHKMNFVSPPNFFAAKGVKKGA
jgi:hypothetical protein